MSDDPLKRFSALVREIASNDQLRGIDWQKVDDILCRELIRLTTNHLSKTAAAVPARLRRKTHFTEAEKEQARRLVRDAVRRGTLPKPIHCERCSRQFTSYLLHAHHSDYSKPYKVTWLCVDCHGQEHATTPRVKIYNLRNHYPR
jgi:hypothetical protein